MSDLKQFLEERKLLSEVLTLADGFRAVMKDKPKKDYIGVYDLGLFFWERGGAEWYKEQYESTNFVKLEEYIYNANQEAPDISNAKDFLDALACLGVEKIKELIKELGA